MFHDTSRIPGPIARIVVVDDDELSRHVVARRLRRLGLDPVLFGTGEAALRFLRERSVQAIVADLYMPGMDGLTLARCAREIEPELPVVLMTAQPTPELQRRALKHGVCAVIGKQVGADAELSRALAVVLPHVAEELHDELASDPVQLAHSLRTPLTAIKSAVDILCTEDLAPAQRRFAHMAQRNADRMIALIEHLLDVATTKP